MNLFEGCHGRQLADGLAWLEEPPDWRFDTEGLHIVLLGEDGFLFPVPIREHRRTMRASCTLR